MTNALFISGPQPTVEVAIADHFAIRELAAADVSAIAEAYRRTYEGTEEEMTAQEAADDIQATWAGEYGPLIEQASFGVWQGGDLAGVILTVEDPPWDDVPRGPFILDLFVTPPYRRLGIGRALVQSVQNAAPRWVALRVDDSDVAALELYRELGFERQTSSTHTPRPN